jgi:hypothetical protein
MFAGRQKLSAVSIIRPVALELTKRLTVFGNRVAQAGVELAFGNPRA